MFFQGVGGATHAVKELSTKTLNVPWPEPPPSSVLQQFGAHQLACQAILG